MVDSTSLALAYSAGIGGVVFIVLWLIFELYRNKKPHIFQFRKWIQGQKENYPEFKNENGEFLKAFPVQPSGAMLSWLFTSQKLSDEDIQTTIGYDTAMYLTSVRNKFYYFFVCAVISVPILGSVYATADGTAVGVSKLSSANLTDNDGRFGATFAVDFVITYFTLLYIMMEARTYTTRREQFRSKDIAANYAVAVQNLRSGTTTAESVRAKFEAVFPGEVEGVQMVSNSKFLRRQFKLYRKAQNKKEVAEYKYEHSKNGERPRHHVTPCTCCCSGTVDSLEYWGQECGRLEETINSTQEELNPSIVKATTSAIVIFRTKRAAAIASQTQIFGRPADKFTITRLESHKTVHWFGLRENQYVGMLFQIHTWVWMFVFLVLWGVISAAVMSLANLDNLSQIPGLGEALQSFVDALPEAVKAFIEGFLPPILIIVLGMLPRILLGIFVSLENFPSKSLMQNKQRTMDFIFLFFQSFLYVVLAGTALDQINMLIENPSQIISVLAESMPKQAGFFLNLILSACFIGNGMALSQIVRVIVQPILGIIFKTPRQRKFVDTFGASVGFAGSYGASALLSIIAIVYTPLAPLVSAFAAVYFLITYAVQKHNMCYTSLTNFDHGGSMFWGHLMMNFISLYIKSFTLIGIMGLNKASAPAAITAINLIPVLFTQIYLIRRFKRLGWEGSFEGTGPKIYEMDVNSSYVQKFKTPELWNLNDVPTLKPVRDLSQDPEVDEEMGPQPVDDALIAKASEKEAALAADEPAAGGAFEEEQFYDSKIDETIEGQAK